MPLNNTAGIGDRSIYPSFLLTLDGNGIISGHPENGTKTVGRHLFVVNANHTVYILRLAPPPKGT